MNVPKQRMSGIESTSSRILHLQRLVRQLRAELDEATARADRLGDLVDEPWSSPLVLRRLRHERGWSQAQVISRLQRVAATRSIWLPCRDTLRIYLSRWENGHTRPSGLYAELLHAVFEQRSVSAAS